MSTKSIMCKVEVQGALKQNETTINSPDLVQNETRVCPVAEIDEGTRDALRYTSTAQAVSNIERDRAAEALAQAAKVEDDISGIDRICKGKKVAKKLRNKHANSKRTKGAGLGKKEVRRMGVGAKRAMALRARLSKKAILRRMRRNNQRIEEGIKRAAVAEMRRRAEPKEIRRFYVQHIALRVLEEIIFKINFEHDEARVTGAWPHMARTTPPRFPAATTPSPLEQLRSVCPHELGISCDEWDAVVLALSDCPQRIVQQLQGKLQTVRIAAHNLPTHNSNPGVDEKLLW
jgi:hypothetical protein